VKIQVLEKIKSIKNLNMLPVVVSKLLEVTSNPKSSVSDVSKVVSSDPTLTANILKIVNSPFYGFPRTITTINQALVILGFTDIRNIALSLTVFDKLKSSLLDVSEFWKHSLGVGIASKVIAEKLKYAKPEEAFICGLLHDIGKLILSEYFSDRFKLILKVVEMKPVYISQAEEAILEGINHAQIGSWVTEKWKLPPVITKTVALHHSPVIAGTVDELAGIVNHANNLCRLKKIGFSGDSLGPDFNEEVTEFLGLDEKAMEEIAVEIDKKIASAQIILNMAQKKA